jgi:hypothetical protein
VRTFTHNRFELISFFSCQGNDVFFNPTIFGEAARVYNGLRAPNSTTVHACRDTSFDTTDPGG